MDLSDRPKKGIKRQRVSMNKRMVSALDVAKIARNVVAKQNAKRMELKWVTTNSVGNAVTSAGLINDLALQLTAGTGQSQRIGNEIWAKDLEFQYLFDQTQATSVVGSIRMIIVRYYTPPVLGNFPNITQAVDLQPALAEVLYDRVFSLANTAAGGMPDRISVQGKIKLGHKWKYYINAAQATTGVSVYWVSDQLNVNNTLVQGWTKVRFYDN